VCHTQLLKQKNVICTIQSGVLCFCCCADGCSKLSCGNATFILHRCVMEMALKTRLHHPIAVPYTGSASDADECT